MASISTTRDHSRIPSALYDETVSVRPLPTGHSTKPDVANDEYYLFPTETKRVLVRWNDETQQYPVRVADVRVEDVRRRLSGSHDAMLGIEYGSLERRKTKWLNNAKKRFWKEWEGCEKPAGKDAGNVVLVVSVE